MNTIRTNLRCSRHAGWPLERVLFVLAGAVILTTLAAGLTVLTALVGVSQLLYATAGTCPASYVAQRVFRRESAVYTCGAPYRP